MSKVKAFREAVKALVSADARYVVSIFYFPDEPGERGFHQVEKLGPKALVRAAVAGFREQRTEGNKLPENLSDVLGWAGVHFEGDGQWCRADIMTLKEYHKQEEERERKACEALAIEIVVRYNVKPNSLAFVAAVHRHYGQIAARERHFREDGESRMERWGCCQANGNTQGFWEDNDYSSSLEHQARESESRLINYLHRYCPLLMARWEERRRRKKGSS